ncbi:MAG TPA: OmpA family protein [Hyphomonadaceae bacterium]|jgi:peptidoglycan-associated lipoprotein|nr:OmpA family protein [Hyphomonadaceae bacterium]
MRSALLIALTVGALAATGCASNKPEEPPPAAPPPPVVSPPPPPVVVPPPPIANPGPAPGSVADFAAKTNGGRDQRVYFDYDKYNVRSDAVTSLQAQASYLKTFQNVTVDIEGNADERGTPEYNVALSERRANSVREYLAGQGIAAARMKIVPRGETSPIASGANEQAWAQNRNAYTKQTN